MSLRPMATSLKSSNSIGVDRFGLPPAMGRAEAEALTNRLTELWRTTFGELRDLDRDLEAMRPYFHPVAQGKRLRETLTALPTLSPELLNLREPLALEIDAERRLITPEGRAVLGLLRRMLVEEEDPLLIRDEPLRTVERQLLHLYRRWSRHRLDQVLSLLRGGDKPLQVPAIGILLTLLVARATAPDRAIRRTGNERDRREIESALFAAAEAFAARIAPSEKRQMSKERLVGGWTIGEVARRIPSAITADKDLVYVEPGHEDEAVGLVARELAERVDAAAVAAAFDDLVNTFRVRLPSLAAHGLAFERSPDTGRLRQALLDQVEKAGETHESSSGP
jgi:hypothetical protein